MEIKKERILEAAKNNPCAKETLKDLFPEVFDDGSVDLLALNNDHFNFKTCSGDALRIIAVRATGEYEGKSFYLDSTYDWEMVRDSSNHLCLIPTKRGFKAKQPLTRSQEKTEQLLVALKDWVDKCISFEDYAFIPGISPTSKAQYILDHLVKRFVKYPLNKD